MSILRARRLLMLFRHHVLLFLVLCFTSHLWLYYLYFLWGLKAHKEDREIERNRVKQQLLLQVRRIDKKQIEDETRSKKIEDIF